ncbi:DUF5133 domain-containing protein [Streptomyces sp. NBC_01497]|uniref:DUF5133 domain-containing protein n=1 Tax=Streptomyces sp. NBC_01497 TaxID=2903885 RepID=UPI002E313EDD|nr:DUF5133 domain-containing protein [Streptomyces sp. NBC_01497]
MAPPAQDRPAPAGRRPGRSVPARAWHHHPRKLPRHRARHPRRAPRQRVAVAVRVPGATRTGNTESRQRLEDHTDTLCVSTGTRDVMNVALQVARQRFAEGRATTRNAVAA